MFDQVFVGHICYDETFNHDGTRSLCTGGAALYGAMAAACTPKRIGAVLMLSPRDRECLTLLRERGIEIIPVDSEQTTRVKVIHTSANVDERQIITVAYAGKFIDLPPLECRHMHLAGCNDHEFTPEFIAGLKQKGYRLSVDMQSFVRYNDPDTGEISFKDDPDKTRIVPLMDKIKLDIMEAGRLTGTDDIEKAARIIRDWGCPEVMITCANGALVRHEENSYFEKFTNRTIVGRTGRGDTTFGAYLARRLDYPPADALKFASALVSIKMEHPSPFTGSLEEVLRRMQT